MLRHPDLHDEAERRLGLEAERRRALPRAVLACGILVNAIYFAPMTTGPLLGCLWLAGGLAGLGLGFQILVLLRSYTDEQGRLPFYVTGPVLLMAAASVYLIYLRSNGGLPADLGF